MENIFLLGSGGREYSMAIALGTSSLVGKVFCAPGNAGIPTSLRRSLSLDDFYAIIHAAQAKKCKFICVGPERPLCDGIVDYAAKHAPDIKVIGPSKLAAEFEGDKHLTKQLAKLNGIRTADYQVALTLEGVRSAAERLGYPAVLKYPYLAAGKGVKIARNAKTAESFAREVLEGTIFPRIFPRRKLLVEQFISGRELSVFAFCNGEEGLLFGEACDYKLATDDPAEDRMTGGMGAYSPVPWVTPELRARIKKEILDPLVCAMKLEGRPYRGILYLGLMIDREGNPWLIEINCRLGDPEAQVILPRLQDGLFADLLFWSVDCGQRPSVAYKDMAVVYTVLCAQGYPGEYEKGYPIGLIYPVETRGITVIHAGTDYDSSGVLVGTDGRVIGSLGTGGDIATARARSQLGAANLQNLSNNKLRYRKDIAKDV